MTITYFSTLFDIGCFLSANCAAFTVIDQAFLLKIFVELLVYVRTRTSMSDKKTAYIDKSFWALALSKGFAKSKVKTGGKEGGRQESHDTYLH